MEMEIDGDEINPKCYHLIQGQLEIIDEEQRHLMVYNNHAQRSKRSNASYSFISAVV